MKIAACDATAFRPFRRLLSEPLVKLPGFESLRLEDLPEIERFIRTVVLHDEIVLELEPLLYDYGEVWPEEFLRRFEADGVLFDKQKDSGGRTVIFAAAPALRGSESFLQESRQDDIPDIELAPELINLISQHTNAGEGALVFDAPSSVPEENPGHR